MTFADQLKTARERLGLTQVEAARGPLSDVSASWIDKAERGIRTPHVWMQEGALNRLRAAKPRRKAKGQNAKLSDWPGAALEKHEEPGGKL